MGTAGSHNDHGHHIVSLFWALLCGVGNPCLAKKDCFPANSFLKLCRSLVNVYTFRCSTKTSNNPADSKIATESKRKSNSAVLKFDKAEFYQRSNGNGKYTYITYIRATAILRGGGQYQRNWQATHFGRRTHTTKPSRLGSACLVLASIVSAKFSDRVNSIAYSNREI